MSEISPSTWLKNGRIEARNAIVCWLIGEFWNEAWEANEVICSNEELLQFITKLAERIQDNEPFKGKLNV